MIKNSVRYSYVKSTINPNIIKFKVMPLLF